MTFKAMAALGNRNVEYSFKGRLDGKTLNGELTGTRGSQVIEGRKIVLKSAKKASDLSQKTF